MSENGNQLPLPPKNPSTSKVLIVAIALIVICALGSYLFFPLLGITLAVTGTIIGMIVASVVAFSIAVLLFFILPGVFIFAISALAFLWVVIALILFPILFPILLPIFIIMLFIGYVQRHKK